MTLCGTGNVRRGVLVGIGILRTYFDVHLPDGNSLATSWIMLTIVIIMKPSYSMTRDRRRQRMLGTVLGCIVAAVVLDTYRAKFSVTFQ